MKNLFKLTLHQKAIHSRYSVINNKFKLSRHFCYFAIMDYYVSTYTGFTGLINVPI